MNNPVHDSPADTGFQAPALLARRLGFFGSSLLVVYAALVVGGILPLKLLDPTWQLRFVSSLLTQAAIPLVGLGFILLGCYVDPASQTLKRTAQRCGYLALLASIGFFLLIPLQMLGVWGSVNQAIVAQNRDIAKSQAQAELFRRLITTARSPQALQQSLLSQRVDPLTPAQLSRPMPVLRSQLLERLASVEQRLEGQPRGLQLRHWLALIQGTAGSMVIALAYGIAFAAGAQLSGQEVSVLDQWLHFLGERRSELVHFAQERRSPPEIDTDRDTEYLEELHLALGPEGSPIPAVQAIEEATSREELEDIRRHLHLSPLSVDDRRKPLPQLKREMVAALTDV